MLGFIDVGGGTRGIFGAGVFDYCLDEGIRCDYFAGVSAGSANGASYLAGQRGRNYTFYDVYAFRKEYMSFGNWVRTGSYIDLDYIYGTLTNEGGENPLDYEAMMANPAKFEIVATDAETGKPEYFDKANMVKNNCDYFKASSCVPVINKPYRIGNGLYFDGGMSDPIPYKRALDAGVDDLVVVLTRPKDAFRDPSKDFWMSKLLISYPEAANALATRAEVYNRELQECLDLEKAGKLRIIAPDSIEGLKTLSKDHAPLELLYKKGYDAAKQVLS